ncbi:MAG: hypothetical protein HDR20_05805, partial [Lachnospiraceae bacterium]|nr:hypothetical protein [Lachnospiraceae bacterium]
MQKRNVKIMKRMAAGAVSAILLFSSMDMDIFAKEGGGGLPSAGIDFILSSDATSVKDLKEEEKGEKP